MYRRRYLGTVAAVGAAATAAGCMEDSGNGNGNGMDDGNGSETDTDTDNGGVDTDTRTETPEATATETEPTSVSTPTPPSDPDQQVAVGADGLNFTPEGFEISVGETVLWEWESSGHNIEVENQPGDADWPGKDEQFSYDEGTVHWHTFEVAGSYDYVCEPHQTSGMTGSFTVVE